MNTLVDVREVLGAVRVPTLVLHRRGDRDSLPEEGRYLAAQIPGARFVELSGADHFVAVDADQILDRVEEFLTRVPTPPVPETALAAILADRDGPPATAGVRTARAGARTVALFDGPAVALRWASARLQAHPASGFGVHVAEVPRHGDRVDGAGPELAGALAAAAEPGQILVSATARDLSAPSGSRFVAQPPGFRLLA
jgi:hypothetical protein